MVGQKVRQIGDGQMDGWLDGQLLDKDGWIYKYYVTSTPIGTLECTLPAFLGNYQTPTDQWTNHATNRRTEEVIGKLHLQYILLLKQMVTSYTVYTDPNLNQSRETTKMEAWGHLVEDPRGFVSASPKRAQNLRFNLSFVPKKLRVKNSILLLIFLSLIDKIK